MRIRFRATPDRSRRVPRRGNRGAWLPDAGNVFDDCRGELALIAERRAAERSTEPGP